MPDEDEIVVPEEETTTNAEETTVTTVVEPRPLTDDEKLALAREYVQKNPEEFTHYFQAPAPAPTPQPADDPLKAITDEWGAVDAAKLQAFLADRDAKNTEKITSAMTAMLAPVMQGFASTQALAALPEAARPYAEEIAKDLKVPLYSLVADEQSRRIVSDAALGRALQAGKIQLPEAGEPVGGASRGSVYTESQRNALADYARISGKTPSAKEAEELLRSGALG